MAVDRASADKVIRSAKSLPPTGAEDLSDLCPGAGTQPEVPLRVVAAGLHQPVGDFLPLHAHGGDQASEAGAEIDE